MRVAYINLIREPGRADPKEAQELARHHSVDTTFNTYGRAREDPLRDVIEATASAITPEAESAPSVHGDQSGEYAKGATACDYKQLRLF